MNKTFLVEENVYETIGSNFECDEKKLDELFEKFVNDEDVLEALSTSFDGDWKFSNSQDVDNVEVDYYKDGERQIYFYIEHLC